MPAYQIDEGTGAMFLVLPTELLVLFQAFIEVSENLALVRTLNSNIGLVALIFSHDLEKELASFLLSLEDNWQIRMLTFEQAAQSLAASGMTLTHKLILGERK